MLQSVLRKRLRYTHNLENKKLSQESNERFFSTILRFFICGSVIHWFPGSGSSLFTERSNKYQKKFNNIYDI
jgi:hypothetical protein